MTNRRHGSDGGGGSHRRHTHKRRKGSRSRSHSRSRSRSFHSVHSRGSRRSFSPTGTSATKTGIGGTSTTIDGVNGGTGFGGSATTNANASAGAVNGVSSSSMRHRKRGQETHRDYGDRDRDREGGRHRDDHERDRHRRPNRDRNREHKEHREQEREHRDRDRDRDRDANNNRDRDRDRDRERGSHRRHNRRNHERSYSRGGRSALRDHGSSSQHNKHRGSNYGIVSDDENPKIQPSMMDSNSNVRAQDRISATAATTTSTTTTASTIATNTSNTYGKNNKDDRGKERQYNKDPQQQQQQLDAQQQRRRQRKKKAKRKEKEAQRSKKDDHRSDGHYGNNNSNNNNNNSRKRRSRRDRNDKRNNRHHHKDRRYRHTNNNDADGSYNTAGKSASSRDIDDSIGHFEGGPDTIIDNRYKIVKDVGMGTFGRVVQAFDLKVREQRKQEESREKKGEGKKSSSSSSRRDDEIVAIKIVRNVKRYHQSALIEADILKDVNSRGGRGESLCAVMKRHFEFDGHCCLVFEKLGRNLYDYMKRHNYEPFPLYCVRDFARQLLDALDFIHSFGLIHTDLKPENILLTSNKEKSYRNWNGSRQQVPASTSIKLIDFGGATYDNEKKSSIINTRQYRAPEVILGLGWSTPSDLWSAGCIISELYLGELLFATHDNSEHLALIELIIGRFPLDMLTRSKEFGSTVFDSFGFHKMDLPAESKEHVRSRPPLESIVNERDQTSDLVGLLKSLLMIDPAVRATAGDVLKATFFDSVT